jgi:hypothetical protein
MSESKNILEKINDLENKYYTSNPKNFFLKKKQLIECAKEICKNIDINEMIDKSIFIIPGKNYIYMDYTLFKLYANPDIFDIIISHIINSCRYLITYYGSLEVFINIDTFTVSAAERYIELIKKYCDICLNENTDFCELLTKLNLLNTPSIIEMIIKIIKPFIDKKVAEKVCFYKKGDDSNKIIESFSNLYKNSSEENIYITNDIRNDDIEIDFIEK